jgi:hypothetical protein
VAEWRQPRNAIRANSVPPYVQESSGLGERRRRESRQALSDLAQRRIGRSFAEEVTIDLESPVASLAIHFTLPCLPNDTAVQRRAREEAKRPTHPSACNGQLGSVLTSAIVGQAFDQLLRQRLNIGRRRISDDLLKEGAKALNTCAQ